jgi:hypothetical protein
MWTVSKMIVVVLVLAVFCVELDAKTISGSLKTANKLVIVENFCFDESGGKMTVQVKDNLPEAHARMVFYSDTDDGWMAIDDEELQCTEQLQRASHQTELKNLEQPTTFRIRGIRPRWWYVGVANCQGPIDMEYNITFTNAGDGWSKHFGYDEQGIHEMSIAFLVIQFLLSVGFVWILGSAVLKKMAFKIPCLLLSSCFIEHLAIFFFLLHLSVYAVNGKGVQELEDSYVYFDMVAQIFFLAVIIALVKGWPTSLYTINKSQAAGIFLFTLNILAYIVMFIYYVIGWTVVDEFYIYDSTPGYVLIATRTITFAWCLYELSRTYRYEGDKTRKRFYIILGLFITFWFLYMPFDVLITHFIAGWERRKAVVAIVLSLNAISYFIPMCLFWPTESNIFFNMMDTKGKIESKDHNMHSMEKMETTQHVQITSQA